MPAGKTLILSDAGPASLLACACIHEAIALGQAGKGLSDTPTEAAVLPFPPSQPRLVAIARQCDLFALPILSPTQPADPAAPSPRGRVPPPALRHAPRGPPRLRHRPLARFRCRGRKSGPGPHRPDCRSRHTDLSPGRHRRHFPRHPLDPRANPLRGLHRPPDRRPHRRYGAPYRNLLVARRRIHRRPRPARSPALGSRDGRYRPPVVGPGFRKPRRLKTSDQESAAPARKHPEERRDIRVGSQVAVTVEVCVRGARRGWAVAAQAGEECGDVRISPQVPIAVEVGARTDQTR